MYIYSLEIKHIRILLPFYASNLIRKIAKILKFARGKILGEGLRVAEIGKWWKGREKRG